MEKPLAKTSAEYVLRMESSQCERNERFKNVRLSDRPRGTNTTYKTKSRIATAASVAGSPPPEVRFAGDLLGDPSAKDLEEQVGTFLRQGSLVAFVVWLVLLWATFRFSPEASYERLEGSERNANVTVLFLLIYTNLSRLCHIVIRDRGFIFVNSSVMVGSLTVQTIAIGSISLLVFLPTPVIVDPVTGIRSHLVRWAEWICASFLMTFLTESVDMPVSSKEKKRKLLNTDTGSNTPVTAWLHGICIALSTSAGAITAFCTTTTSWLTVLGISWTLFSSLFVRLYQRYERLQKMSTGVTIEEKEDYDRAKYSLKAIAVCTTVWTGLAGSWTVIALVTPRVTSNSLFSNPALVLITESIFEAISKIWYADMLIEIHNRIFDDASRTMRRLEELRNLMAAVWDHSSDILIWGCRVGSGSKLINGVVSPKGHSYLNQCSRHNESYSTLLLEINTVTHQYRSFMVDLSAPITREAAMALLQERSLEQQKRISFVGLPEDNNLSVIADLLCEADQQRYSGEKTVIRELASGDDNGKLHQCEAKIAKLGPDSCLIVMRDISERYQRFEAEKKLIQERTARRKDFEANRFTRHEVKNGLLAAIGLVESIRTDPTCISPTKCPAKVVSVHSRMGADNVKLSEDVYIDLSERTHREGGPDTNGYSSGESHSVVEDSYDELDNTLRDVLDTIMDHAMSLDVVNEEYDVRLERVAVPELLSNIRRKSHSGTGFSRFQFGCTPVPFPTLGLDPRLLRHIYQNALSNACRYGKADGKIETKISYDEGKEVFKLEVINEPGPGHEKLLNLTPHEVSTRVFSQGTRLEEEKDIIRPSNSSGDGAWIMKKCSNILKGDVDLIIESDRTIFSFWCPAKITSSLNKAAENLTELSTLPPNTWGIVIDDSLVQRKLMDRFLKIAGIAKNRRLILGKDADEIYGFADKVTEILASNPHDKVIVIADENLDVVDGVAHHCTVSGSRCIEKLLDELDPILERRLLALVRSANDSKRDITLYKTRAHGFLLKAPIDKDGVLTAIQPWWVKRFGSADDKQDDADSKCFSESTRSLGELSETCDDISSDIVLSIEVVAALCKACMNNHKTTRLRTRWKTIREKLHALKGDLKSTIQSGDQCLDSIITEIDALRREELPLDLQERWDALEPKLFRAARIGE